MTTAAAKTDPNRADPSRTDASRTDPNRTDATRNDVPGTKQERTGRLSADDWANAALDLIAEQGVASVAVEPLARRLGVTKGSFYWHFPSREALLVAALERWEKMEQDLLFGELEPIT